MKINKCKFELVSLKGMKRQFCDCGHEMHAYPIPKDYGEAFSEADIRFSRGWLNVPCRECGHYGWRLPPGRNAPGKTLSDLHCPSCGDDPNVDCSCRAGG